MFWENFSAEFLATLIGLIIGIPIALWIDRRSASTHSRVSAKETLEALKDEISHNKQLLEQIKRELTTDSVIFYNLQLSTWRTVSIDKLGSVVNADLIRRISSMYYEFEHFSRKIDTQFEIAYSPVKALANYREMRRLLVNYIHIHLNNIIPDCEKLLTEISSECTRLKN